MKVFSFSIYGDNPIYTIGGVKNAKLIKELFPDWKGVFYIADDVDKNIVEEIENQGSIVELIDHNKSFTGMFWRFAAISNPNIDVMIVRDCDSRLSERDVLAIQEFMESDKNFHIIRDHPIGHHYPINGGMWGCKKTDFTSNLFNIIEKYLKDNYSHIYNTSSSKIDSIRNADQIFLKNIIYPMVVNDSLIHDEYFKFEESSKPINHDRKINNFAFIGESIDENDKPRGDQRSPIINIYNNKLK
jgi:hypothetical protein